MAGEAEQPKHFQSGFVSVPIKMADRFHGPEVEEEGKLVAGTFGYTIDDNDKYPVVEAKQGWILLVPKNSPIIARFKGEDLYCTVL